MWSPTALQPGHPHFEFSHWLICSLIHRKAHNASGEMNKCINEQMCKCFNTPVAFCEGR